MTKIEVTCSSLLGFLLSCSVALAGSNSLKGRSTIELNIGLWHESNLGNEMSTTGIVSTAKTSGFLGGLSYGYWLQENLSVVLSVGVLSGEATSSVSLLGTSQRSSAVIPILLGIRYYVPESSLRSPVLPFLSLSLGSFVGVESKSQFLSQESRSEAALGTKVGGGIDFLLSESFKLDASAGYNLMTDFSAPIGARKNYNGPEFSLGFGIMFGQGSE